MTASLIPYMDPERLNQLAKQNCEELIRNVRKSGVCSLSMSFHDLQLWQKYGDDGKGVAIEFEVEATHENGFYKVEYLKRRPELDINNILLSAATDDPKIKIDVVMSLICRKTKVWKFENEIRHLSSLANQYAYIAPIKRVLFGPKVPTPKKREFQKTYPNIEFVETKIFMTSVLLKEP